MKFFFWIFSIVFLTYAQVNDSLLSILDSAMIQMKLQKESVVVANIVSVIPAETEPTNDKELIVSDVRVMRTTDSLERSKEKLWKSIISIHKEILKSKKQDYTAQENVRMLCFLMNKNMINNKTAYLVDSVLMEINGVDLEINNILFEYARNQPTQSNVRVGIRLKIRALQEERKKLDRLLLSLTQ